MSEVSYKQIEEANKDIKTMKIGNGDYAKVNERVKAFRKVYPGGTIITDIEELTENGVRIKATVKDAGEKVIATGRASETKENNGKSKINLTSLIENCETSAVGRALGFAGFGIDAEIATGEDMAKARNANKSFEIAPKMFIREEEAAEIIKLSVKDLMRKMGVVVSELNDKIEKELWTDLSHLNAWQYLKLETRLKTLNNEDNVWHDLYAQNSKIKEVVAKNTSVSYITAWERLAKVAIQQCGTNESLKNEVIDFYLDAGIDLTKENG